MKGNLGLNKSQGNNEGQNGDDEEDETPFPKVSVGEKATENSTINGEESSPSNPIIPTNYYPIDTDTSSWGDGTDEPTAEDVSEGLVITDSIDEHGESNGNEWVWVPVEKNVQGKAISNNGTSDVVIYQEDGNGVSMYTNASYGNTTTTKYSTSAIISGKTRGLPSSTSYREPAMIVGTGTQHDNATSTVDNTKMWYEIVGFSSLEEMAEGLRDDYADMIESIETYGGFYIGRYELSTDGVKRNQTVASGTINGTKYTWYQLYSDCKSLGASDSAQTRMIWGNLWDVTCNWIATDANYSITNSSTWGNYSNYNSSVDSSKQVTGAGSKQVTGFSEYWKVKNIYDFAGNCYEWTQEANNTSYRVDRGGDCFSGGSYEPVSNRFCVGPPNYYNDSYSSRPILYVK